MPPPSGASFAQFFPAAPRAARDRAKERERARTKTADSHPHSPSPSGRQTPILAAARQDDPTVSRSRRDGSVSDAAHPATDDTESLAGDILNTVSSTSSHTSAASSVFSSSSRLNGAAVSRNATAPAAATASLLTPLTSYDSPSYPVNSSVPARPTASTPLYYPEKADGAEAMLPNGGATAAAALPTPFSSSSSYAAHLAVERVPARDAGRAVKAIACTYDPLLDKTLSNSEKRKAKSTYKEYGAVCIQTPCPAETIAGRGGKGGASSVLLRELWLITNC